MKREQDHNGVNKIVNNPKELLLILKILIPLIEDKYTQREVADELNKSLGWVNKRFQKLEKLGVIEKKGKTSNSFFIVNYYNLNNVHESLIEVEKTNIPIGEVQNVTVKFIMKTPPENFSKTRKVNMNHWTKYLNDWGGISIEWSTNVAEPYFMIRYPRFFAKDFKQAETRILDDSRKIALDICRDYGMRVLEDPKIKYGEIAFKHDPVAEVVTEFGNYKDGKVKCDKSPPENVPHWEPYGSGDKVFKLARGYSSLQQNLGDINEKLDKIDRIEEVLDKFAENIASHQRLINTWQQEAQDRIEKTPKSIPDDFISKRLGRITW